MKASASAPKEPRSGSGWYQATDTRPECQPSRASCSNSACWVDVSERALRRMGSGSFTGGLTIRRISCGRNAAALSPS